MKFLAKILIVLILISSCKKTNQPNLSVAGNWELREVIGGFDGDIKYAAGNGNIIQFSPDMTFKMIYPTPPDPTGKYQIINVFPGTNKYLLHLDFDSASYADITDSLKIEGNLLTLSTPPRCCDIPYATVYAKLP